VQLFLSSPSLTQGTHEEAEWLSFCVRRGTRKLHTPDKVLFLVDLDDVVGEVREIHTLVWVTDGENLPTTRNLMCTD